MKHILSLFLILLSFHGLSAQIVKPVKWVQRLEKISGKDFNLIMEAVIDDDWHMYSQFTPDGGSLAMFIEYKNQPHNYQLIGKTKESTTKHQYNEIFKVDEILWEHQATLTQHIKLINPKLSSIEVRADYQACKEVCINDNVKFTFNLPKVNIEKTSGNQTLETPVIDTPKTTRTAVDTITVTKKDTTLFSKKVVKEEIKGLPANAENIENGGLCTIFFLAFGAGFTALLTPCVFPMIPMTVSLFTKQSKSRAKGIRNAVIYGFSIIAIYIILGLIVTKVFGADALNALSTDVWFNLVFFVILIIFAASFLGAFEIMLPNSWANKADQQADRGGIIGILFMALALAIVSFSCTGPIVGTLLVEAASKGGIAPIVGMLGFSSALALPFMLFAMFPGWLSSLPKSGGWLNTVKVVLGFLELALAFKFLSNADLVLQLHFLEREVFLAIWIAVFGSLAFYLFGKITLPHDSPSNYISVGRLSFGLLVLSFTVYLIPGLWGAPLKLISAFPPPATYSESPLGFDGSGNASGSVDSIKGLPDGSELGPHAIMIFHDYEDGLAYAKSINKPIMLDFTGYACVNCRKMENNVWSDERILPILKNDVVLISLYVDDKRELPAEQQFVTASGDKIVTVGDKWTDFMISKYKTNTQPLYVLLDSQGKDISSTISYTGTTNYLSWLKKALKKQ